MSFRVLPASHHPGFAPVLQNGHRAELWDLQNPLATVHVSLVRTADDSAVVRLKDPDSKELFAEAPVTAPLHACVERAIDSSRYFCVRIVDGATRKHAFIGLGFASREPAGDFFGALIDHQQYLERKAKAADGTGISSSVAAAPLHSGVTLKLNSNASHQGGGFVSGANSSKQHPLAKTFSLMFAQNGGVEAALSSASNDSSPHAALPGRLESTSVGMEEQDADGGWGAFEES
jgi:hypothetical protein